MNPVLTLDNVSLNLVGKTLLHSVSGAIPEASLFVLLGPNGAGKTLLLRCLAGLTAPTSGLVTRSEKALAWVPLSQALPFHFSVREMVLMGRFAQHQGFPHTDDHRKVEDALDRIGILAFADRSYNSLSRGEQSKADIARAIASDARLILLDEPFSNLDIDSVLHMIVLFKELSAEGRTLVLSHHDLFTVSDFASHALLLKEGRVLVSGTLTEVFQEKSLAEAYNVRAVFHQGEAGRFIRIESLRS